jgi:transposase
MLARTARCRQALRVAERVRVREIDDDEGQRPLRIIRRGTGSVVTWRRAQMVLLSAQGMPVAKIVEVTFTSTDWVRDVIHNFNADGFEALYPKYKGGRPRTFTLSERREIKKIAKSKPAEHGLPFSTWSLVKLADFLVAEGMVNGIGHEGLRGAQPPAPPRPAVGRARRTAQGSRPRAEAPTAGDLHPRARGQAPVRRLGTGQGQALRPHQANEEPHEVPGVLPLPAQPLPPKIRIAIVLDNFSPHLTTKKDTRVGDWAAANNVEFAYTPTNSSWLNRVEAQFTALRYFALDGTDHASHKEQGSMIRRYIIWRNKHAADERLREVVNRANVA